MSCNDQFTQHGDKTSPHNVAAVHHDETPQHQNKSSREKEQKSQKKVMAFHRNQLKKKQTVTLYPEELYARQQQGNKALLM